MNNKKMNVSRIIALGLLLPCSLAVSANFENVFCRDTSTTDKLLQSNRCSKGCKWRPRHWSQYCRERYF